MQNRAIDNQHILIITEKNLLQQFLNNKTAHLGRTGKFAWIPSLILFAFFAFFLGFQLHWQYRINNWIKCRGTILKNNYISKGKKRYSEIYYSYQFDGKNFYGNKIICGESIFPRNVKPGTERSILVDPDNPERSAAMVYYTTTGNLLRFTPPFVFLFFALLPLLELRKNKKRIPPGCPDNLIRYLQNVSQEELHHASRMHHIIFSVNGIALTDPPVQDNNCIFFKVRTTNSQLVLLTSLCAVHFAAAYFASALVIPGILYLLLLLFCFLKPTLVIDFSQKKIYRRNMLLLNKKSKQELAFDRIHHYCLHIHTCGNQWIAHLHAVSTDGKMHCLIKAAFKKTELLLEQLPQICSKTGNQPILFY